MNGSDCPRAPVCMLCVDMGSVIDVAQLVSKFPRSLSFVVYRGSSPIALAAPQAKVHKRCGPLVMPLPALFYHWMLARQAMTWRSADSCCPAPAMHFSVICRASTRGAYSIGPLENGDRCDVLCAFVPRCTRSLNRGGQRQRQLGKTLAPTLTPMMQSAMTRWPVEKVLNA